MSFRYCSPVSAQPRAGGGDGDTGLTEGDAVDDTVADGLAVSEGEAKADTAMLGDGDGDGDELTEAVFGGDVNGVSEKVSDGVPVLDCMPGVRVMERVVVAVARLVSDTEEVTENEMLSPADTVSDLDAAGLALTVAFGVVRAYMMPAALPTNSVESAAMLAEPWIDVVTVVPM